MLSLEENQLLTQVGPGTPMGNLMRRFWLPVLLARELPIADGDPVRVLILGERLVATRDTEGRVSLLAENCPHRGASLFFGRNEDNGLRCVYHGWKFGYDGTCLDMPNEPAESDFHTKVRATAYPCREFGGLIWAYMGPREHMGELPLLEWATVPSEQLHISKWLLDANYLQGMEGEVDTTHISFLHTNFKRTADFEAVDARRVGNWRADTAPKLMLKETDYGFVYGGRRTLGGIGGLGLGPEKTFHWRLTHWLLPTFSMIPGTRWPIGGRCWIPIDDHQTWVFNYWYNGDTALTDEDYSWLDAGVLTPPIVEPKTFRNVRNKSNDYLLDRQAQRTLNFTGIFGGGTQDQAMTEGMGAIYDRRNEHLGSADMAVIAARRILLRHVRRLQEGTGPFAAQHGDLYRVRALDVATDAGSIEEVLDEFRDEVTIRNSPSALLNVPLARA
jgi:phenylpropionate dioxygenase-like ring-hydroxylating dioxygenase large terminal subunit